MKESLEIRPAVEDDIPSIVSLLKLSLGESLMPKSEQFWRWKHIDNPFGRSPVLVAFDRQLLVGVRAFMRWEWTISGRVVTSVRAVDTATHPEYQGRGIFSSLTSRLADECLRDGIQFIFNTPNKKSMPGYLKLGWQSIGKLNLHLKPCFPLRSRSFPERNLNDINASFISNVSRVSVDKIHTHYSYEYIRWRYIENPNANYRALTDDASWLLIYRLKPLPLGTELRVVDFFGSGSRLSDALRHAGKSGATLITMSGSGPRGFVRLPLGPEVTVRMLASSNSITFQSWRPSLGDLELF